MRVLVCGGRDYDNAVQLQKYMNTLDAAEGVSVVIHGAARGADSLAGRWGISRRKEVIPYPADWRKHGRAAGPIRNKQMLDEGKPDLVIAFLGGRGTENMIKQATAAGVPVRRVT